MHRRHTRAFKRRGEGGGEPLPDPFPTLAGPGFQARFRRSELSLVAAEPGDGKSTFALVAAVTAALLVPLHPLVNRLRFSVERWADEEAVRECGDRNLVARTLGRVALIGASGSGKSTVSRMLVELGAHLVDTDAISRDLTAAGGDAIEPIRQAFGSAMIDATGAMDRAQMRAQAFADDAKRWMAQDNLGTVAGQEDATPPEPQEARQELRRLLNMMLIDRLKQLETEALTQAASGQDPDAQQRWRSLHERRKELMAAAAITTVQ